MSKSTTTVRIKVSPQVVRIVGKKAPRDLQLSAARGALPLDVNDLLTVFFFFCNGKDLLSDFMNSARKSYCLQYIRGLTHLDELP